MTPPPSAAPETPPTGHRLKLDYLTATFPAHLVADALSRLKIPLGPPELIDRAQNGYAESYRWKNSPGAFIAWHDRRPEACINLSGDGCDRLGPDELLELLRWVYLVGGKCTRVDTTFDDFDRTLWSMDDVHRAGEAGNVSGPQIYRAYRPLNMLTGDRTGDSAYFGGEQSSRQVLFYDKALESDGVTPCNRLEVKHRHGVARVVGQQLAGAADVEDFTRRIGFWITSAIAFVNRRPDAHGHVDRMAPLPWWSRLLDLVGAARYGFERVKPTIVRKIQWLRDGVARSLALATEAVASAGCDVSQFLRGLVAHGRDLLTPHDLLGLAAQVSHAQVAEISGRVAPTVRRSGAGDGRGDPARFTLPDVFT